MQCYGERALFYLPSDRQCGAVEDIAKYAQGKDSLKIIIDHNYELCLRGVCCQSLKHIEFVVGRNASLTFLTNRMYDSVEITCMAGSRMYYVQVARVNASCCTQSVVAHVQEHALCVARIFPFLDGTARCSIDTLQEHPGSYGTSDMYVQGFVSNAAQFDHRAMIVVPRDVQKISMTQKTVVIMAGEQCRASVVPAFSIESKDVHCDHGAALGRCDELERWYLSSRGLDEKSVICFLAKERCLAQCAEHVCRSVYDEIVCMIEACLSGDH
jgi:Fe-S cluster assembly scaffold protein SufB